MYHQYNKIEENELEDNVDHINAKIDPNEMRFNRMMIDCQMTDF